MDFTTTLQKYLSGGLLPDKVATTMRQMYEGYVLSGRMSPAVDALVTKYLDLVYEQCQTPFIFEPFHKAKRTPFDYYRFGLDLLRPLMDSERSVLLEPSVLEEMNASLEKGDNIILLANHQSESDPQLLSLLLEKQYPRLAENIIFVAGDRVVTDPVAIPVSMGCNLLCIYSKKHIDNPPEQKEKKQRHNQKTMKLMSQLLSEGGKCIYVAPSGGRDRLGPSGKVEVAPFDPNSLEMFRLMAGQSAHPTHFHTLALDTFDRLPPPRDVEKEIGEARTVSYGPIKALFGPEVDFSKIPGSTSTDRQERRQAIAEALWQKVNTDYTAILNL